MSLMGEIYTPHNDKQNKETHHSFFNAKIHINTTELFMPRQTRPHPSNSIFHQNIHQYEDHPANEWIHHTCNTLGYAVLITCIIAGAFLIYTAYQPDAIGM